MHITILQDVLKQALSVVKPAVQTDTKAAHPIRTSVLVTVDDGHVVFSASNDHLTIRVKVAAKIWDAGRTCIPFDPLSQIVSKLPKDAVDLELNGPQVSLTAPSTSTIINVMDPDDFPAIPSLTGDRAVPLGCLDAIVSQVAPAAATDFARPVLSGIHLTLDTIVRAEAADGFRCARLERDLPGSVAPLDVLVPAKGFVDAVKSFQALGLSGDDDVFLGLAASEGGLMGKAGLFVLDAGFAQVWTRILDGDFPNVDPVLRNQDDDPVHVRVAVADLLKALDQALVMSTNNITYLTIARSNDDEPGKVTVEASTQGRGVSMATATADVSGLDGTPMRIAVNGKYFRDCLTCLPMPMVHIAVKSPVHGAIFRPIGHDGTYLHIVQPMTTRN